MTRTIQIPNGRSVSLGAYVAAWKRVKALAPDVEIPGWEWYPVSARSILRDLRRGMHDRITQGVSYTERKVSL